MTRVLVYPLIFRSSMSSLIDVWNGNVLGTGLDFALGHRSDMDIGTVYAKRHHCVAPLPRIRSYCSKRWYSALNTFGGFVLIFLIGLSSTSGRESPRISWRVGRQCLSPTQKAKVSGLFGCRPTAYLLGPAALAHRSPVIDFATGAWDRVRKLTRKPRRIIKIGRATKWPDETLLLLQAGGTNISASDLVSRMVSLAATPPPVAAAVAALSSLTNSTAVPRVLDYIAVHHNGSTCQGRMHKADLSTVLGCPSRDLRLIDTHFPYSGGAFVTRPNGVLLCLGHVRAVLTAERLMVFDPNSKPVETLMPVLQSHLASGYAAYASETPFEHLVLEAILHNACHQLQERIKALAPQIFRILGDLRFRHGTLSSFTKLLDELLPLRNGLSEIQSSVADLRKAIHEVLNSDEDMASMYLTATVENGLDRAVERHQEVEMMFENYLMQVEWTQSEISEIQQAIRNTEDTVEIQLDLLRNRILRVELLMNVCQMVLGVGALVSGIFGMNLPSGLENCPKAFGRTTTLLVAGMVGMFAGASIYGKKAKVL